MKLLVVQATFEFDEDLFVVKNYTNFKVELFGVKSFFNIKWDIEKYKDDKLILNQIHSKMIKKNRKFKIS